MEHGADPNVVDDNRDTALHVACRSGHADCLRVLLTRAPDVNYVDASGTTGQLPLALEVWSAQH